MKKYTALKDGEFRVSKNGVSINNWVFNINNSKNKIGGELDHYIYVGQNDSCKSVVFIKTS